MAIHWKDKDLRFKRLFYFNDEEMVLEMIASVGELKPGATPYDLADKLDTIAGQFDVRKSVNSFAPDSKRLDELATFSRRARSLLKFLDSASDSFRQAVDPDARDDLLARLTIALGISDARAGMAAEIIKHPSPNNPRFDFGDLPSPEHWLIGRALPEIYNNHFARKFGIATGGHPEPHGPGIRFINHCLKNMNLPEKSGHAIEKHWDRSRRGT